MPGIELPTLWSVDNCSSCRAAPWWCILEVICEASSWLIWHICKSAGRGCHVWQYIGHTCIMSVKYWQLCHSYSKVLDSFGAAGYFGSAPMKDWTVISQLYLNTGSSVYSFSLIKCKIMMRISVTPTGAKKSKKNVVWWLSVDWSSPWAHVYKWSLSYLYVYSELNRLFWHAVTSFSHWLMFAIETGSAVRSILSLSAQKTWCERKSGCSYIRGYVIVVLL